MQENALEPKKELATEDNNIYCILEFDNEELEEDAKDNSAPIE